MWRLGFASGKLLLEHKAAAHLTNRKDNKWPYHLALESGHQSIAEEIFRALNEANKEEAQKLAEGNDQTASGFVTARN